MLIGMTSLGYNPCWLVGKNENRPWLHAREGRRREAFAGVASQVKLSFILAADHVLRTLEDAPPRTLRPESLIVTLDGSGELAVALRAITLIFFDGGAAPTIEQMNRAQMSHRQEVALLQGAASCPIW